MIPRRARCDIKDQRDADDRAEPIEAADPIDKTEPIEPTLPIDKTEPTLPIDKTDPLDPIDRMEFSDQSAQREVTVEDEGMVPFLLGPPRNLMNEPGTLLDRRVQRPGSTPDARRPLWTQAARSGVVLSATTAS